MTPKNTGQALLMAWLGLVVIQVARTVSREGGWTWPPPRVMVAPSIIYTILAGVSAMSAPLALSLGIGIDLAVALAPAQTAAIEASAARMLRSSGLPAPALPPVSNSTSPAPAQAIQAGVLAASDPNASTGILRSPRGAASTF